ncbi:MAG: helix-turn-helix domain-containing protein, partial [Pseudonocardia sp.]
MAVRSRIVLAAAEGLGNTAVAAKVGVEVGTARRWRDRFLDQRLEGLLDEPRPGRPRTVTDDQVE